jgi:hypothetical protein
MAAEHQARRQSNAVRVISSLNQLHEVRRTDWLCELDRWRQVHDCSILTAYSPDRVKLIPTHAYTLSFRWQMKSLYVIKHYALKTYGGFGGIARRILNLGTKMGRRGQLHTPSTLPTEMRLGGTVWLSGVVVKRNICCLCQDLNSR